MNTIVELLRERNHFLEKFYSLNEKELFNFGEGNFDNLDGFYQSRERVLGIINQIEDLLAKQCTLDFKENKSNSESKDIIKELDYKNELVTKILSQDLQALTFIEEEKSKIIKELSSVQSGKRVLNSYQTKSTSSKLSEKA